MSEITVNIDEFLTDDDKREIAKSAFREAAERRSNKDFERILSNAGYALVQQEVDAVFDGEMASVVRDKAIEVIRAMSSITVFKRPDAWDREASKGWMHLQSAMDEAKPLIAERVNEIVRGMDITFLHDLIQDRIAVAIIEKLQQP